MFDILNDYNYSLLHALESNSYGYSLIRRTWYSISALSIKPSPRCKSLGGVRSTTKPSVSSTTEFNAPLTVSNTTLIVSRWCRWKFRQITSSVSLLKDVQSFKISKSSVRFLKYGTVWMTSVESESFDNHSKTLKIL